MRSQNIVREKSVTLPLAIIISPSCTHGTVLSYMDEEFLVLHVDDRVKKLSVRRESYVGWRNPLLYRAVVQ